MRETDDDEVGGKISAVEVTKKPRLEKMKKRIREVEESDDEEATNNISSDLYLILNAGCETTLIKRVWKDVLII